MTTAETTSTAEAKERSGAGGQGARKDARALLGIIAAILVVALFCSYYLSIARKTDICFDGAVFLQPIVALERFGVLTHTYNTQSPAEFHLPLTNLGQGMLSQNILNWPFIHLFGINHFALQAANLIFLGLGGALMYLLVLRSTGNRLLPLAGVLLFYTAPQMKGLGLQGLGEVPAASYLLLCAMLLYLALSRGRYFGWLGIAVFLAFHTKNYLILVYPMLLLLLTYLWLRQKTVRFRDLIRFSGAFWLGLLSLPLIFILRYGWSPFLKEISDFWTLVASTQWGESLGAASRSSELTKEAFKELSRNYGGWFLLYPPTAIGYLLALLALVFGSPDRRETQRQEEKPTERLSSRVPWLDPTQAVLVFLLGISVFYVAYWFHFSTWAIWYRRVFPFLILQIPLLLIAMHRVWVLGRSRRVFRVVALTGFAALLVLGFAHAKYFVVIFDNPLPDELALQERVEATKFIRSLPADAQLFGLAWWQAPKLSLFSGRTFLDLTTKGEEYSSGLLILDREAMGIAADGVARRLSSLDTRVVWQNRSNRILEWKRRTLDLSKIRQDTGLRLLRIGPDHSSTAGERFPKQPGGTFAMWAITAGATPKTVLVWDGLILDSSVNPDGKLMTAMVPRPVFAKPGRYNIALYDIEDRRRSNFSVMVIEEVGK